MIKVGTKVKMIDYDPEFNNEIGEVISHASPFYKVRFNENVVWDYGVEDANIWRLLESEFEVIAE